MNKSHAAIMEAVDRKGYSLPSVVHFTATYIEGVDGVLLLRLPVELDFECFVDAEQYYEVVKGLKGDASVECDGGNVLVRDKTLHTIPIVDVKWYPPTQQVLDLSGGQHKICFSPKLLESIGKVGKKIGANHIEFEHECANSATRITFWSLTENLLGIGVLMPITKEMVRKAQLKRNPKAR